MIYFMLLREIVIFGIVVGGKLYVDKMLVLFIIEVGCFFCRGEVIVSMCRVIF